MPITRRQYRKSEPSRRRTSVTRHFGTLSDISDLDEISDSEYGLDVEEELLRAALGSDTESSSGEISDDSEYRPRSKGRISSSARKRQRVSVNRVTKEEGPSLLGRRKRNSRKSLSILPTMPLDVLYEILEYLHPLDLLILTRTNKVFRGLLITRKSTSVWKRSQQNTQTNPPDCPTGMSEAQWANLLWGCACQGCGAKPVVEADFGLRRRLCVKCKKKHFVCSRYFTTVYPHYYIHTMDLLLYTHMSSWAHGRSCTSKFFWDEDAHAMGLKIARLEKAVHMREPYAKAVLNDFISKRKEFVETVAEFSKECTRWARNARYTLHCDRRQARREKMEEITRRLEGISEWSDKDKSNAVAGFNLDPFKPFTEDYWKRIWPRLKALLDKAKSERQAVERSRLVYKRQEIASQVYYDHIRRMKAIDRLLCPPVEWIRSLPQFMDIIEADNDVDVNDDSFNPALVQLPALIEEWNARGNPAVKYLRDLVAQSTTKPSADEPQPEGYLEPIRRATAVFHKSRSWRWSEELFIGFEAASVVRTDHSALEFRPKLSSVVSAMLKLLGLDERTTHPFDLDAHNPRFVCLRCLSHTENGIHGRLTYHWRQLLNHYIRMPSETHNDPSLHLLTPEEADDVKQREYPDSRNNRRNWLCMSCSHPPTCRPHIVSHIQREQHDHINGNPVEGRDYFWEFNFPWHSMPSVLHGEIINIEQKLSPHEMLDNMQIWYCLNCPTRGTREHFNLENARVHLFTNHAISQAIIFQHYAVDKAQLQYLKKEYGQNPTSSSSVS